MSEKQKINSVANQMKRSISNSVRAGTSGIHYHRKLTGKVSGWFTKHEPTSLQRRSARTGLSGNNNKTLGHRK